MHFALRLGALPFAARPRSRPFGAISLPPRSDMWGGPTPRDSGANGAEILWALSREGRATAYRLAFVWRDPWVHAGARLARPVPGALMVMSHHVGIVLQTAGRRVLVVSGNYGRRVGVGWYNAGRAIAFVAAGRA